MDEHLITELRSGCASSSSFCSPEDDLGLQNMETFNYETRPENRSAADMADRTTCSLDDSLPYFLENRTASNVTDSTSADETTLSLDDSHSDFLSSTKNETTGTSEMNCNQNASCSSVGTIETNGSNVDHKNSDFRGFEDCPEDFDLCAYESELNGSLNSSNAADSYKNIQKFFVEQGRIANAIPIDGIELKPSAITSVLRPYQAETVRWMIMRETKREQLQLGEWCITLPPGGILADEMGLGKTVEVLACMLNHSKKQVVTKIPCNEGESPATLHGKRRSTRDFMPPFMKKKPRLSAIQQNRTLKTETGILLQEYFEKFNRDILRKREELNEKCRTVIETCFKVLLLHRYYNNVKLQYPKFQTWGYLVSEFSVVESDTVGYSILLKDTQKKGQTLPAGGSLEEEDAVEIIAIVNAFLDEKRMKKFEQDFYRKMRYGINVSAGEFIPLLEGDDVRCSCGSDKAKGKKIKCCKCNSLQHLQCVGLDKLPEDLDGYRCPICWMNEPVVESAATLIVVPCTLAQQWTDEIKKHASDCDLKMYCYMGVKNNYTLPPVLASYDIVLTTFQTLRNELSFVSTNETRSLRHCKRYQSFVTPLTCIHWWRLCVDEAQMVESANKVSEMAALIKTVHLWAVTGTPVGKSLHDLFGMTTYLRIKPFTLSEVYWKVLLTGDQSLLHRLFAYLMRRKTKEEVYDQLKIPELTVDTQWLSFPPTEGYFYKSTHEQSESLFRRKINSIKNLDQQLKKANRYTVESVLAPLLALRQACVNPMAVSSMNVFNMKEGETMQNLLEKMIKKTKVECEDTLRLYVMQVNGSAGLHITFKKFADAVTLYRSVLSKMKIFIDLQPDSFQMMHVMHNLYETAMKDSAIELTEEETKFPEKIAEMEKKCLEKKQEEIDASVQQLLKYTSEVNNCLGKLELKHFSWWQNMLNTFDFNEIVARAMEDIERDNIELTNVLKLKLSSVGRLNEALKFWLADVESKRNLTFLFFEQLSKMTTTESLWTAADHCHLRKEDPTKSCLICRMESLMRKYESLLFNMGNKANPTEATANEPGKSNPIDWKNSAFEYVLNALLSSSRSAFGATVDNINAGNQLKALGLLKREFKAIRAVWSRHSDLLHVYDEIRMAKSTIDETAQSVTSTDGAFHLQVSTYHEQSANAYSKLQSKYGSLQYLKNLETRYKTAGNVEEACPVCHTSVDEKRAVMSCGHFTCYGCMQTLITQFSVRDSIHCPICRTLAPLSTITYVYGGGMSDFDTSNVQGNHSIKINAITAKVLSLVKEDPKVKILGFSTWQRAVREIERAFLQNQISFKKFSPQTLAAFKAKHNINVLLMPLRSGSKGLNLTEASHIIFTEPVLNVADEKQAIGRIYRLGQSKNMTVHKFIIKRTVEEHIHKMTEELQKSGDECELTFRHLLNLF